MNLHNIWETVIKSLGMQTLTYPLFYNSKVAIRFNIGDNGNEVYLDKNEDGFAVNPEYVSSCFGRAKQIYNHLRNAPNVLIIEGCLYENDSAQDFINTVITVTDLPQPQEAKIEKVCEEDMEVSRIFLYWKLKEFDPDKLLKEIIMADLGGSNILTSSVYFVCADDNVLFHLYDDRGADICAEKTETISHIYRELNDLISDYDRERIDSIFKAR